MDKIGMGVICKNCGKVFGEHFNGDSCPTGLCGAGEFFDPENPPLKCQYINLSPTQPSEVGPFIEIIFDASNGPMNMVFVEVENEKGQSVNVGEWHDQAEGYSALRIPLGQSTARSKEGRLREALEKIARMPQSESCIDCGDRIIIAKMALTASPEASQE